MSAKRTLGKMVDWPGQEEGKGNATAEPHFSKGTNMIRISQWSEVTAGWLLKDWSDEPVFGLLNDPVHYDPRPSTVLVNVKFPAETGYTLIDMATTQSDELTESLKLSSPAYELFLAITRASEDQRVECMQVLGLIDRDEDDYTDPGPDPQPVDFDWLASIRAGRSPS
jgi:hypothetical protein